MPSQSLRQQGSCRCSKLKPAGLRQRSTIRHPIKLIALILASCATNESFRQAVFDLGEDRRILDIGRPIVKTRSIFLSLILPCRQAMLQGTLRSFPRFLKSLIRVCLEKSTPMISPEALDAINWSSAEKSMSVNSVSCW